MKLQNFKIRGNVLAGMDADGKSVKALVDRRKSNDQIIAFSEDFIKMADAAQCPFVGIVNGNDVRLFDTAHGVSVVDECSSITWIFGL